ncbi:hypothetical protein QUF72_11840 [Desulfobacterales bacterium HSG2]|nr:hypothetical protein [Desulfobacterales bacterium HSG2]
MMMQKSRKRITDKERLSKNLGKWADITALCLELRKSYLKTKYGITDDGELTKRVFSEIVRNKERRWISDKF